MAASVDYCSQSLDKKKGNYFVAADEYVGTLFEKPGNTGC